MLFDVVEMCGEIVALVLFMLAVAVIGGILCGVI
jgi:hypothetical protein